MKWKLSKEFKQQLKKMVIININQGDLKSKNSLVGLSPSKNSLNTSSNRNSSQRNLKKSVIWIFINFYVFKHLGEWIFK